MTYIKLPLKKALQHPGHSIIQVVFRGLRGYWWRRYARLSHCQGLDGLFLILSFDCDTDQDAQAAATLHSQLIHLGVKPVYAVPGQILENNPNIFNMIYNTGGQFINHGYYRHTYFNEKQAKFQSCFFYDQLSPEKIEEDIRRGDETLKRVLRVTALGFRTPHFGTFQGKKHLKLIYSILGQLGYRFSTSTIPLVGFLNGPIHQPNGFAGIAEFQVSGRLDWPLSILDSWRHWDGGGQLMNFEAYRMEVLNLVCFFTTRRWPGLLNLYVDPLHVAGSAHFLEIMAECVRLGARSADYETLISGYRGFRK